VSTRPASEAPDGFGLDRVIHEPARLALLANLEMVDEADFVFLARRTKMTSGNISSHMARLQEAGYVEVHKGFAQNRPRTVYMLTPTGRQAFARYRQVMAELLDLPQP